MVLGTIKETAEAYLGGHAIAHAVIRVAISACAYCVHVRAPLNLMALP